MDCDLGDQVRVFADAARQFSDSRADSACAQSLRNDLVTSVFPICQPLALYFSRRLRKNECESRELLRQVCSWMVQRAPSSGSRDAAGALPEGRPGLA